MLNSSPAHRATTLSRFVVFLRVVVISIIFLAASTPGWAQPDNDLFANARLLRGISHTNEVIFLDAGKELGEPSPPYLNSIWFVWNSPGRGTLATYLSDSWAGASIFTGNSVGSLLRVGHGFAFVETNVAYRIAVESTQPLKPSTFWFRYWPALTNDLFTTSTELTGIEANVEGMFARVNYDDNEPLSRFDEQLPVAWWTWTAPENGVGRFRIHRGDIDFRIFTGDTLANLSQVANGQRFVTEQTFRAEAGRKYHIAISASGLEEFDFTIVSDPLLQVSGLPANGRNPHTDLLTLSFSGVPSTDVVTNFSVHISHLGQVFSTNKLHSYTLPQLDAGTNIIFAMAECTSGRRYVMPETPLVITHPNDSYASRPELAGSYVEFEVDLNSATSEYDSGPRTVWWQWTAPASGRLRIERLSGSEVTVQPFVGTQWDTLTALPNDRVQADETYQLRGIPFPFVGKALFALIFFPDPAPNDSFSQRQVIGGTSYDGWLHGGTATAEAGEAYTLPSFWFSFTAPGDGLIEFGGTTVEGAWSPLFSSFLYQGSNLGALTEIQPILPFGRYPVVGGQTYQLCVRDFHHQSFGRFRFHFLQPPANDTYEARTMLEGESVQFSARLDSAKSEPGEPPFLVGFPSAVSVWFTWTAPSNGWATLTPTVPPELSTPNVEVFTETPTNIWARVPNFPLFSKTTIFPIEAGKTYNLRLSYSQSPIPTSTFTYDLAIHDTFISSPLWDSTFTLPDVPTFKAFGSGGEILGATMLYYKQIGYNFDGGVLYPIVQQIGSGTGPQFDFIPTDLAPGSHLIHAALVTPNGRTNYSFPVQVHIRPANDNFTNRSSIEGRHLQITGSAVNTTIEADEAPWPYPELTRTVWYSWTAEVNGPVVLKCPNGFDIRAFTGSALNTLTQVSTNYEFSTWDRFHAVAGNTYTIALAGISNWHNLLFNFTLDQETISPSPDFPSIFNSTAAIPLDLLTSEPNGNILKTEYFHYTNRIASALGGTATHWTNPPPGYYMLTAVVYLASGEIISNNFPQIRVRPPHNTFEEARQLTGTNVTFDINLEGGDDQGFGSTSAWFRWRSPANGYLALSTTNGGGFWGGIQVFAGEVFDQLTPVTITGFPEWSGWATAPVEADVVYYLRFSYSPSILPSLRLRFFDAVPANTSSATAEVFSGGTIHREFFTGPLLPASPKLWWTWQFPVAGLVSWNGSAPTYLYEQGSDDLIPIFPTMVLPNKRYYLSLDAGYLLSSIDITFSPAPANDNFTNRIQLSGSRVRFSGSLHAATSETLNDPPGAWWEWTAPQTGPVLIRCLAGQPSVALKIHPDGPWPNLNLSYFDSALGQVRFNAVQGNRYFLLAGRSSGGETQMELLMETSPGNDSFSAATALIGNSVQVSGNNWGARRELSEPQHPDGYGGRSVWYSWRAPTNTTHAVRIEIVGDLGHTLLAAYEGATNLAQLNIVSHSSGQNAATATFIAEPGHQYHFRVEGLMGNTGDFTLNLVASPLTDDLSLREPALIHETLTFKVDGLSPANLKIESSGDLLHWQEVPFTYDANTGTILIPTTEPLQFYRAYSH